MSAETFISWGIETGLVVSALILLILLIRRPFSRWFGAGAAYALWSLPLIRLFMPVIAVPERWLPQFFRRDGDTGVQVNDLIARNAVPNEAVEPSVIGEPILSFEVIVVALWAVVAVLWLVLQLYQQQVFKAEMTANSQAVEGDIKKAVQIARERVGLKSTPIVRMSHQNIGPLVTGVISPLVILPANFETVFEPDQRTFALIHEFAHIKRRDLWAALTVLIFRAFNWPNPLVHFAAHRLRADQESACDAYVVRLSGNKSSHSYAETLVKAVGNSGEGSGSVGQLALSLTDKPNENFKRRLK